MWHLKLVPSLHVIAAIHHFEKQSDKIAHPDCGLAIRSDERRKSRKRAHLANAGEFNRHYPTRQTSAILYADRGDRRIKSPSVSSA